MYDTTVMSSLVNSYQTRETGWEKVHDLQNLRTGETNIVEAIRDHIFKNSDSWSTGNFLSQPSPEPVSHPSSPSLISVTHVPLATSKPLQGPTITLCILTLSLF